MLHRNGPVDVMLWGVAQTGRWGVQDHRANAVAVEVGWQPKILAPVKPWIRAGYQRGSGDKNPLDSVHGSFFQILPTPRPYARFPFFNLMNNEDAMGTVILRPSKKMSIRSEVHALRLAAANDLWYQGGGAFQPWTFGYIGRTTNGNRGLATLYDVGADYAANSHWTISAYYGRAQGHSVTKEVYPRGKNANLGYVELLYRF